MEENQINRVDVVEEEKVEQTPDEHPMTALMEDALSFRQLKSGDIVDGEIVSVTPTEVLVDVGAKSEGLVPSKELERFGREGLESLKVGQVIPVYVVRPEDRDGNLVLSIRRAEEESDWRRARELHEESDSLETQVAGFNKGGLIVRLGKLRGFVPASQLAAEHRGNDQQQPEERWAHLVGSNIHVKVIEINRKRKRLILSERAALRTVREAQKAELLDSLRAGEVRSGVVSSLADFGAFVNLGGADGLIHLSELSWNRSAKPRDVLKVGQKVEVYVLNVDREKKRIALSLKRLEPEPWVTVESRYYVGQLVEGTVTRLANFGAFALVNDELEGLIHISELSSGRINHPQEVVQEGEKHVMRIIRIDPKRRRMGLSLKRVSDPEYADLDWQAELAEAESSFEQEEADSFDRREPESVLEQEEADSFDREESESSFEAEAPEPSFELEEPESSFEHDEAESEESLYEDEEP
ncbi:MAG TPA: S1 RNA-binding domain-containing protein [Anaerolineae bacterium]|nr:S1 RNA-binding domain-containing protein [Anaerolineae bacterium]